MTSMAVFTRSDGATFTFGTEDMPILEFSGIGKITPEIFTKKKPIGHGSIITGMRLPEREFGIKADLIRQSRKEAVLREMNSFFNPTYTFDVEITYMGVSRKAVDCRIRSFDAGSGNYYAPLKPSITMLCEEAFFLSVSEYGKDIAGATGGFHFPYHPTAEDPIIFGLYAFANGATLSNDGDVETYIKARFVMTGDAINPRIMTGDSYVKVLDTFVAGDVLVIDASNRTVTKNGQNISTRIDKGSRWTDMVLTRGYNQVQFACDSGSNNLSCYVYFNNRYLGVI